MKKRFAILIALGLIWAMVGCSSFASAPRIARIQLKGPGNQAKEFVFSLDDPTQKDMDIRISDRYAIELDLQWLWFEKEDVKKDESTLEPLNLRLTPWLLCKYRF